MYHSVDFPISQSFPVAVVGVVGSHWGQWWPSPGEPRPSGCAKNSPGWQLLCECSSYPLELPHYCLWPPEGAIREATHVAPPVSACADRLWSQVLLKKSERTHSKNISLGLSNI